MLDCRRCDTVTPRVRWREFVNETRPLDARLPGCERHLRFVPQIEPWLGVAELVTVPQQLALF